MPRVFYAVRQRGDYNNPMLIAPPLSLYIHIPWCVKKCPYCDFNSHAQVDGIPQEAYVTALLADLDRDIADYGAALGGRALHSIFFGGGTPSLFSPDSIARILDGVKHRLDFNSGIEITLETNPGTVEHGRLDGYLAAGVNRISFGVQSFDDGCLQRLGRIHSSGDAERAVKAAQDAGLDNLNIDLMYALPGQSLAMALVDVERALALQPTHMSHYQLTLEPNTVFAARPPAGIPDEDGAWDMQDDCQALLAGAGFAQYEVSAYARDDRQCAHNLNYWRFGDYLGIGAGAHGKLTLGASQQVMRRWKHKRPADYLAKAGSEAVIGGDEILDASRLPFDFMLNALRLNAGVPMTMFEARTGLPRSAIAEPIAHARASGWIEDDAEWLRPTELGRRFTNDVIGLFLP